MSSANTSNPTHVSLPKPSVWPLLLALGVTLAAGGLIGIRVLTITGGVLALAGAIGWIVQVLPHDRHENVPVLEKPVAIAQSNRESCAHGRDPGSSSRAPAA